MSSVKCYFAMLLLLTTSLTMGYCLTCNYGGKFTSSIGLPLFTIPTTGTECDEGESCISGRAEITFNGMDVVAEGGTCVNSENCGDPCPSIFQNIANSLQSQNLLSSDADFSLRSCSYECCNEDYCNNLEG